MCLSHNSDFLNIKRKNSKKNKEKQRKKSPPIGFLVIFDQKLKNLKTQKPLKWRPKSLLYAMDSVFEGAYLKFYMENTCGRIYLIFHIWTII